MPYLENERGFTFGQLAGELVDFSPVVYMLENMQSPFFSLLLNATTPSVATAMTYTWRTEEYGEKDSSGQLEGGAFVEDVSKRTAHSNNIEIFRKEAKVSGTLNALHVNGIGNELKHQVKLRLAEMKRDINNKLINGTKTDGTQSDGGTMNGILNLIDSDNILTEAEINIESLQKTFKTMFDAGFGGDKVILLSSDMMASLNLMARKDGTVSIENGDVVWGINTTRLVSSFGTGTMMIDSHVPAGTMIFLDLTYLELKHIRAFQGKEMPTTDDALGYGIVGEFGLVNKAPKASAVLKKTP